MPTEVDISFQHHAFHLSFQSDYFPNELYELLEAAIQHPFLLLCEGDPYSYCADPHTRETVHEVAWHWFHSLHWGIPTTHVVLIAIVF